MRLRIRIPAAGRPCIRIPLRYVQVSDSDHQSRWSGDDFITTQPLGDPLMIPGTKWLLPAAAVALTAATTAAYAASHREAPLIALDPSADNTDVYAFVSYDPANLARAPDDRKVTFIENVNPGQDPADGPNYFNF